MILLILLFTLTLSMLILALSGARLREEKAGDRFTEYVVVLFLVLWFAVAREAGPMPVWMPFLVTALFAGILVASLVLAIRPPKVVAWTGERRFARQDIEAVIVDAAIWIMMLVFGFSVLGRFQW